MSAAAAAVPTQDAFPELNRELTFTPLGVEQPKVLSREQIGRYNELGYVAPISVFDAQEAAKIRQYFDTLLPQALGAGWDQYEITNWHKYCRGVWDLVMHPRLLDLVSDLLGDTVICRHSHFFAKLPYDERRVSWHQDASYWPLSKSKVVTIWLAIDDADEDNSCLQIVPRSHLQTQIPFMVSPADEKNVLTQRVDNPERYGSKDVVPLVLKAGQVSIHSDWLLHGSEPNTSGRRRCGFAMRFLSADVKAFNGWNVHSIVCRGEDPSGHWHNHPRPAGEFIPIKGAGEDANDPTRSSLSGAADALLAKNGQRLRNQPRL
jgi:non-heme Fe2+,alpha-ketoglutarate-dependent halogenase